MDMLAVEISPSELSVVPGEQTVAEVTVRNAGARDEPVRLLAGVRGLTTDWLTIEPPEVLVPAHGACSVVLRARPAASGGPPAGVVRYEAEARSERDPEERAAAAGTVVVAAVHDVVAVLSAGTAQVRGRGLCRVEVENRGNVQEDISLVVHPRHGDDLEVVTPPAFRLPPGRNGSAELRLRTPRRWFGEEQVTALVVDVRSGGDLVATLHLTAVSRPLFPRQAG